MLILKNCYKAGADRKTTQTDVAVTSQMGQNLLLTKELAMLILKNCYKAGAVSKTTQTASNQSQPFADNLIERRRARGQPPVGYAICASCQKCCDGLSFCWFLTWTEENRCSLLKAKQKLKHFVGVNGGHFTEAQLCKTCKDSIQFAATLENSQEDSFKDSEEHEADLQLEEAIRASLVLPDTKNDHSTVYDQDMQKALRLSLDDCSSNAL